MLRHKWVLFVEDNPDHVALALRALKKNGMAWCVVVARDGVEALSCLAGPGDAGGAGAEGLPQLVLLDLQLPRVDGLEVLRRIRTNVRTRLLPVVVLSSSDEERDMVLAYNLGANSYVSKPVNFDAFVAAMRQIGDYWLDTHEDGRCQGVNVDDRAPAAAQRRGFGGRRAPFGTASEQCRLRGHHGAGGDGGGDD